MKESWDYEKENYCGSHRLGVGCFALSYQEPIKRRRYGTIHSDIV